MGSEAAEREALSHDDQDYPELVARRWGDAPPPLTLRGRRDLLRLPLSAVLCSRNPPPELVLPAIDLARELREAERTVVGGFQSPVESVMLDTLLRGEQPLVICPAREIAGMRPPREWERALANERLLLLSAAGGRRRVDARLAAQRNRLVAALARELFIVHAAPGGQVHRLVVEALRWGVTVHVAHHPSSRALELLGALPWAPAGSWAQRPHPVEGHEETGPHVRRHGHPEGRVTGYGEGDEDRLGEE